MATTINADTSNGLVITPDTSGDINLQSAGVTKASITSAGLTVGGSNISPQPTFRNRIINGNMTIDQRFAGAASTPANNIYTLDRWNAGLSQGSKYSVQQVVDAPDGLYNSVKMTVLATATLGATDYFMLKQKIEGYNVADFNFGTSQVSTITVSFWVKSTVTGTFGGSVQNSSEARGYAFNYAISSANTWEKKSVTLTGDTTGTWDKTTGTGLWLNLALGVGTTYSKTVGSWVAGPVLSATGATNLLATGSATIQFTGVQLEAGTTATDFENLQYGQQLALCQRYYEQNYGTNNYEIKIQGLTSGLTNSAFRVSKRADATTTVYSSVTQVAGTVNNGNGNVQTAISSVISGKESFWVVMAGTSSQVYTYYFKSSSEL